jgi:putative DNA primase/helicase
VMGNAPEWAGRIRLNEFSGQIAVDGKDLDDVGPIILKAALERDWIPEKIPTGDVLDALSVVASRAPFHPVRDYLDSLTWDGVERIPTFFGDHCGCANDDYHMAVARSLFVSSVARIYRPGCKVDTMVILESEQGMGKTKLWLTLYGEWCSEVTASLSDKDFYAGLRGVWAVDFAELDAFSKSETTQIKRILTSQSDSYRPHYGRSIQVFPRQSIFVGGTNRDDWNTDATGARRFLPVRIVDRIDIDAIASARDQLWAEAVVRFKQDEIWWEIPNAQERQEDTYQGDPWEDVIAGYLVGREEITVSVILSDCLRIETGKQNRADQMRASSVLKRLDWERKRRGKGWYYRPKPAVL